MESILTGVFIFHLLHCFLQASAFPKIATESFLIHYLEDRRIIPVRVELNTNSQTEHVTSVAGETLYDFSQGKVAYKDFNSSQCFITDIVGESLEKDRRRLKNLQNGIVRGFYLPTFIIQEELNDKANFTENFGVLLAEFCAGNTISFVIKQTNRRKRDTTGQKGQFTQNSYGHYGHQSNNYAHYGHETRVTGTVDENGQIRNQNVNHQQIRSESSHVYPRPAHRNGRQDFSRSDSYIASRPVYSNGRQDSTTDSRMGANIPQTHYQTQYRIPPYQQTFGGGVRSSGTGGAGQFSLQSSHEGGYQLSLPLGLQAGNVYRGGVRSGGHYGVGGIQPQITTEHQQYPDSTLSAGNQPFDQRQPFPPLARPSHPSTLAKESSVDMRKIPSSIQPGISAPAMPIDGDRRVMTPTGIRTSDTQTPFTTSDRGQQRLDHESQLRKQVDHRTIPSASSADDRLILPHTPIHHLPSRVPDMRSQTPSFQPGISLPSIHTPSGTVHGPLSIPGQISGMPSSDSSGMDRVTRISRPSQIHGTYPDLISRQQNIPSGIRPEQQFFQTPDTRQQTGYRTNGDMPLRPVPPLLTPGSYPSYPSTRDTGMQQVTQESFPRPSAISDTSHMTLPVSHETIRNGVRYPDATRPQTAIKDEYPSSGTYPGISRVPIDRLSTSVTRMHPGETQLLPSGTGPISPEAARDRVASRPGDRVQDPRYNLNIPSRSMDSESSIPRERRIMAEQSGLETSRIYGQDSASSQTQIQTALEGTAAEASAAGRYRGLGSQTQVQGGYAGNGSFSAQAQSGFTGGVVQSQVQGGKQGGLSGSSAQIERVGSAQSQVQVLQPSGSASSTAQGRFTGGSTQVQAQSSKTGGSAGAQSQSTGLSSSHVQVNIGGKDVSEDERFQGTVSASVHGGQSTGQSETQMQGGYDSGRTYAATAQGGFDTALGFQSVVPPMGSLTNLSSRTLGGQQPISATDGQESFGTFRRDQQPISATDGQESFGTFRRDQQPLSATGDQDSFGIFRGNQHELTGMPTSRKPSDATTHQVLMPPVSHTQDTRVLYPSSAHEQSSLLPPSIYRGAYPGYPSEVIDRRILPPSPGDYPGHRTFDERGVLTSGFPQTGTYRIPEQQMYFGKQVPESQDRVSHEPVSQRSTYPSLPAHALVSTTDQHYPSGIPSPYLQHPGLSNYHPSQSTATMDSSYIPTFPSRSQQPGLPEQPGLQTRYLPTSHVPDQSHILAPGSQMVPSHKHPYEMPLLTRPDGSPYIETTHRHQPMPDATKIQPEQHPILFPSPQVQPEQPRPQIQPQYPPVSFPGSQIQPKQTPISPLRPQIQPEPPRIQPETPISPPRPQIRPEQIRISTTTEKVSFPSEKTEIKQDRMPGVSEPDKRDCCAALRDLKRRCCGGTSKHDETSLCCRSSRDDIFDFSSDDDLDEEKEPCKVVKAICYIVYKPVGKARVCKPTSVNGC